MEKNIPDKGSYVQISVSDEQKRFARKLVEHSLAHHFVSNIWDKNKTLSAQGRLMRFTGTLGEIVFADCYHLPRPTRSFGAVDGQDLGQDFLISGDGNEFSVDIKSMKRRTGELAGDYVLNIPSCQLHKKGSKTTHYFCISFHQSAAHQTVASLLGFLDKDALAAGQIGQLYRKGTTRVRSDKSTFQFFDDTYEVLFSDFDPPIVTEYMRRLPGFAIARLR